MICNCTLYSTQCDTNEQRLWKSLYRLHFCVEKSILFRSASFLRFIEIPQQIEITKFNSITSKQRGTICVVNRVRNPLMFRFVFNPLKKKKYEKIVWITNRDRERRLTWTREQLALTVPGPRKIASFHPGIRARTRDMRVRLRGKTKKSKKKNGREKLATETVFRRARSHFKNSRLAAAFERARALWAYFSLRRSHLHRNDRHAQTHWRDRGRARRNPSDPVVVATTNSHTRLCRRCFGEGRIANNRFPGSIGSGPETFSGAFKRKKSTFGKRPRSEWEGGFFCVRTKEKKKTILRSTSAESLELDNSWSMGTRSIDL